MSGSVKNLLLSFAMWACGFVMAWNIWRTPHTPPPPPPDRFMKAYRQGRYLPDVGFQVFDDRETGQEIACASAGGYNDTQCWLTGRVWKTH